MLYTAALTVPAGTQLLAPSTLDIELSYGSLRKVWLHFPPGCRGTVSVALFHRLQQVAPATPGEGIALDDVLFGFPTQYDLTSLPYTLQLRGWSPDASFAHTITVYLDLAEPTAVESPTAPGSALADLLSILSE